MKGDVNQMRKAARMSLNNGSVFGLYCILKRWRKSEDKWTLYGKYHSCPSRNANTAGWTMDIKTKRYKMGWRKKTKTYNNLNKQSWLAQSQTDLTGEINDRMTAGVRDTEWKIYAKMDATKDIKRSDSYPFSFLRAHMWLLLVCACGCIFRRARVLPWLTARSWQPAPEPKTS